MSARKRPLARRWSDQHLTRLEAEEHQDEFLPTPREIARACRRIRAGWDRDVLEARVQAAIRGRRRFLAIAGWSGAQGPTSSMLAGPGRDEV